MHTVIIGYQAAPSPVQWIGLQIKYFSEYFSEYI